MFLPMEELIRLIAEGKTPTRYLFAIVPPRDIAAQIVDLEKDLCLPGRRILPEHLHLTLLLSPDLPDRAPGLASRYIDALEGLALPACLVRLNQLSGRDGWAGLRCDAPLIDVIALRDIVAGRLRRRGLPTRSSHSFTPHVTLAHRSSFTGRQRLPELSWLASELALIESSIGQTRHCVLQSWTLGTAPRREQYQLALAG